jgi:hypothetical protein
MPYRAKVIKVMIAGPSDVSNARHVVRNVIQEWNNAHAEDKNIVLMPVDWESHSAPSMGDRPQAIINKRVLADCDLLVAVFWTKIGTPTGKAVSGTVEEIDEHVKAKKPAMIYFSTEPVLLESVDQEQYAALRQFKEELRERGLYEQFESPEDFRGKLTRQLAQTVNHYFGSKKNALNGEGSNSKVSAARPTVPALTDHAKRLLLAASTDPRGTILKLRSTSGLTIQTNGENLVEDQQPRSTARWQAALNELRESRLVQDRGHKGEVLGVTDEGYRVADLLREERSVSSVLSQ